MSKQSYDVKVDEYGSKYVTINVPVQIYLPDPDEDDDDTEFGDSVDSETVLECLECMDRTDLGEQVLNNLIPILTDSDD